MWTAPDGSLDPTGVGGKKNIILSVINMSTWFWKGSMKKNEEQ